MIMGAAMVCANSSGPYSIAAIDGAVKYTWTVPEGSMVTAGQDTEAVTIKFGANNGQVCVTYNDGCVDSLPSCVDVTITGGAPGSQVFSFTGGAQEFVLPACVSAVTVELFGAQGRRREVLRQLDPGRRRQGRLRQGAAHRQPGRQVGRVRRRQGGHRGRGRLERWSGGRPVGAPAAGGSSDVRIGGAGLNNRSLVAGGGGGGNCGCPRARRRR
jgi:hypothetical protein